MRHNVAMSAPFPQLTPCLRQCVRGSCAPNPNKQIKSSFPALGASWGSLGAAKERAVGVSGVGCGELPGREKSLRPPKEDRLLQPSFINATLIPHALQFEFSQSQTSA